MKERPETIILKEFQKLKPLTTSHLAKKLKISRQAVHRYLKGLQRRGQILVLGTSRKTTTYLLDHAAAISQLKLLRFHKRYRLADLEEGKVFEEAEFRTPFIKRLTPSVKTIFHYAFTEMVNNAIDHSQSLFVEILVQEMTSDILFSVVDSGVGIFENIRAKKGLQSELEAIQDLLKGKQTTAPGRHSGEGIFFTSKVADRLVIESHRKKLVIDNRINDIFIDDRRFLRGTQVHFTLNKNSPKQLEEIFRQYTNEDFQFDKSRVTVKLFDQGDEYISRSQAKRLLHALDRFREITLDFQGVRTVGQGFADEIFRIYLSEHPDTKIIPVNCNENVAFMIERAKEKRG